jgi:fluoride ion exporter CrcB/FEX
MVAFTTWSTYALDAVSLWQKGQFLVAIAYKGSEPDPIVRGA